MSTKHDLQPLPAGFTRPFKLDLHKIYILDATGRTAADLVMGPRARGWGRIQYQPDGDAQMSAWTAYFNAVTHGTTDPQEILRRLNLE